MGAYLCQISSRNLFTPFDGVREYMMKCDAKLWRKSLSKALGELFGAFLMRRQVGKEFLSVAQP
jgi:hypothetical protein